MSGYGALGLAKFYSLLRPMSEVQVHDMMQLKKREDVDLPPVLIYRPLIDEVPSDSFRFMVKNQHISDHYLSYDFLLLERRDRPIPYVLIQLPFVGSGGIAMELPVSWSIANLSSLTPEFIVAIGLQVLKLIAGEAGFCFSTSQIIKAASNIEGSWPERLSEEGARMAESLTWFPGEFLLAKPIASNEGAFIMYEKGGVKTSYDPAVGRSGPVGGSPGDELESDSDLEL